MVAYFFALLLELCFVSCSLVHCKAWILWEKKAFVENMIKINY